MPQAPSNSFSLAIIWLTLLAVLAMVYFLQQIRKSEYSMQENVLYLPTFLMGRLLWRVQFTNEAPPELAGGAILVANHRSSVDPFFVQLAARRRVHWMVAKEFCSHFLFGPILRLCQVIPTNRSGMDTASTRAAIHLTEQGKLVGMFPEGRLNLTAAPLLSIRSGAALVAARANVPIIPLWIEGSPYRRTVWSPIFMPAHVRITFGTPIAPAPMTSEIPANEHSHKFAASDAMILAWAQQIVIMAKCPNFQIELAAARRKRS